MTSSFPRDLDDYIATEQDTTFYHITRTSNVANVLKRGLRTSRSGGLSPEDRARWGESSRGRISLSGDIGSVLSSLTRRKESAKLGRYTILRVRVPKGTRLYEDEDWLGRWSYVKSPIPPSLIQVVGEVTIGEGRANLGLLPTPLRSRVEGEMGRATKELEEWD